MYKIKHLDNQITHCHVTSRECSRPIHKVHVATWDWSRSSGNNGKSHVEPLHSIWHFLPHSCKHFQKQYCMNLVQQNDRGACNTNEKINKYWWHIDINLLARQADGSLWFNRQTILQFPLSCPRLSELCSWECLVYVENRSPGQT